MKKIPTLFLRDEGNRKYVTREVNPEAQWVIDGEGIATRKLDGSCCLVRKGKLYKRYELKLGKSVPTDFEPATEVDPNTGKQQGWLPVGDGAEDQYHREAWDRAVNGVWVTPPDGTYELIGPKIQGNPEGWSNHFLHPHDVFKTALHDPDLNNPSSFNFLCEWLLSHPYEGIVWHHPDGRMAKLKRKDMPPA